MTIDINCDMGEGMTNDSYIMPYISSANIACGYHAGDKTTMCNTIDLCLKHKVAIGAHPGFNDKESFGRKPIQLSKDELHQLISKQLEIIQAICKEKHTKLHHVKLHGALYNMAAKDKSISKITAQAVKDFDPDLIFYGLSGSVMIEEAKSLGLKTANEVFADRTYQPDGTLTPRTHPHALFEHATDVVRQIEQIVKEKYVTTLTGEIIPLSADTICIHGDGDHALEFAKHVHKSLQSMGCRISADSV
ncbi:MAG: LamB/YcsF family protein [Cyclobacteriaceae bacterium]|nr:LamB/YcsF family protein [Cyclobacteriaceae bacterium]